MNPPLKRISVTLFVKTDEMTARQMQNAIESFVKTNYGVKDEQIQGSVRTPKDWRGKTFKR